MHTTLFTLSIDNRILFENVFEENILPICEGYFSAFMNSQDRLYDVYIPAPGDRVILSSRPKFSATVYDRIEMVINLEETLECPYDGDSDGDTIPPLETVTEEII